MEEKIRLQKYVSDCGLMSRRRAEEEIKMGSFKINGIPAGIGDKIDPETDEITYRGTPVKKAEGSRTVVIMLNKPRGVLTSMSDDRGRTCVSELTSDVGCRVYPCGRLDLESEGLLLMTNDGELANYLTHPSHHIPKTYHVRVAGQIEPQQLDTLRRPMEIDDYITKPARVEIVTRKVNYTVLAFTLKEGRNRQIRKMCQKVGLEVQTLRRISIGPLQLGMLKPGMWKKLNQNQIEELKHYKEK